jgi:hypothetical protein
MTKEKVCGIYCIENLINFKKYIGLSTNISKRFKDHKNNLRKNKHINDHLQSAWNMYGESNFEFYIIEICDADKLKEREIYYIDRFMSRNRMFGYNKTSGGDGIKDLSSECGDKISISETLYPVICLDLQGNFVKEYRNANKAALDIGGRSANIYQCCAKAYGYKTQYGYIWMYKDDYLKNGCDINNYQKENNGKNVDVYDLYGNYINTYGSARDVERILGIPYKSVSQVCNGQKRQSHGYICRFKGDKYDKFPILRKDGILEALR